MGSRLTITLSSKHTRDALLKAFEENDLGRIVRVKGNTIVYEFKDALAKKLGLMIIRRILFGNEYIEKTKKGR